MNHINLSISSRAEFSILSFFRYIWIYDWCETDSAMGVQTILSLSVSCYALIRPIKRSQATKEGIFNKRK